MFLLVLAQPGCPGQSPESCKIVVVVVVVHFILTDRFQLELPVSCIQAVHCI